ncbi:ABC transporter permease subunit [Clostridia bacterium]|jgi:putative chitobiose transport system permease protein
MRKLFRFKRLRRGGRSRVGNAALFVVMIALSVLMIAPLVYSVINSFKPLDELFAYPPRFFVVRPTMENYSMLFKLVANMRVPFSRYLFNSAFITALTTVASVVIASMAAYPLAKYKLRLGWLFDLVVLTLLFNGTVLALPQYVIMARLHLINTMLVYIIPNLAAPLGLFLMKQFMERIPMPLIESARIDGATQFQIFFRIVMPQVKPAWMTLTLFTFQSVWAQQPLNMVFDENLKLLNMAFTNVIAAGISRMGPSMASAVVLMLPLIVVFLVTQSNVIETMSASGIKE